MFWESNPYFIQARSGGSLALVKWHWRIQFLCYCFPLCLRGKTWFMRLHSCHFVIYFKCQRKSAWWNWSSQPQYQPEWVHTWREFSKFPQTCNIRPDSKIRTRLTNCLISLILLCLNFSNDYLSYFSKMVSLCLVYFYLLLKGISLFYFVGISWFIVDALD